MEFMRYINISQFFNFEFFNFEFFNYKCDWCQKRKSDVIKIKIWCKYYNMCICENCYEKKMRGEI